MRSLILIVLFQIFVSHDQTLFAQDESEKVAFYAGLTSNAPTFGIRSEAYNLRFDPHYFWLSTSIGIESKLTKTEKSTFITQLMYQTLPHASMELTQSESTVNGVLTRKFDSLIMKSDNIRFTLGVKHYFSNAYDRFYLQYNVGLNLIFNQTSVCSCTRIESEVDNFYSETGSYSSEKSKSLIPELSLSFGYMFRINDRLAIDTGLDIGVPFGKMKYLFVKETFPVSRTRTTVMNLNGMFLTGLIEAHAKFLFIK